MVLIGLVILAVWVFVAVFASVIAPTSPIQQDVMQRLRAPDRDHWFGTDELGRDIFTRVLYGGRITMPAGILVIVIGCTLGMAVGAVAGYVGGVWDELIMRVSELFMAFPTIILALAITAALGPDLRNAVIALVIVWWPGYARLIRGLVMEVKTREFVEGARSIGASSPYILFRTVSAQLYFARPGAGHSGYWERDPKFCRAELLRTWTRPDVAGVGPDGFDGHRLL